MNKKEVKNILISMRTPENEIAVNHLLGQLDMKFLKVKMRKNILLMICLLMEYQGIVFTYTYQQTYMN